MLSKFTLRGKVESGNALLTGHWSKRHKYSRFWFHSVIAVAGFKTPKETKKVFVWLKIHRARLIDQDNCILGCKSLIDSLTRAGYLKDDNLEFVTVTYEQLLCKKGQERVEIEIA